MVSFDKQRAVFQMFQQAVRLLLPMLLAMTSVCLLFLSVDATSSLSAPSASRER